MITLQAQPSSPAFSRNEMLFKFLATDGSGNLYGPTGVRSKLDMTANFTLDAGDTFVIEWTEPDGETQTITFTASDAPAAETDIPSGLAPDIGFTQFSYWSAVSAKIQAHHLVAPFFSVYAENELSGCNVYIVALELDAGWSVTIDASGFTNSNYTVTDYDTQIADTTPANYRIILDVFFESDYNSGEFTRILQAYAVPGADGIVRFDISDVIDQSMRESMAELPIPVFSDNEPYIADNLRRYYVRYRESYTDQVSPTWSNSAVKLALCGGIADTIWANYNLFDNLKASNSLLTWVPNGKQLADDQPEWLGWYNYTGSTKQIVLECKRWNASGSLTTLHRYDDVPIDVANGETLLIPVGPAQLDIDQGENIQYYEVRVVDAASDWEGGSPSYLSQSRTYYVDRRYYLESRYVMYLNGFCLPETLHCTGDMSREIDITRVESTRPALVNTTLIQQNFQWREHFQYMFTYRSGFLTEFEADALQELLIYNQLWEVFEEGYIPLTIVNHEKKIASTRQSLYSVRFVAEPRLQPGSYSNIFIPPVADQDAWQTDALAYWRTVYGLPWETP